MSQLGVRQIFSWFIEIRIKYLGTRPIENAISIVVFTYEIDCLLRLLNVHTCTIGLLLQCYLKTLPGTRLPLAICLRSDYVST